MKIEDIIKEKFYDNYIESYEICTQKTYYVFGGKKVTKTRFFIVYKYKDPEKSEMAIEVSQEEYSKLQNAINKEIILYQRSKEPTEVKAND